MKTPVIYGGGNRLVRRLRLAWAFKVWPWNIPPTVMKYLEWPIRLTERDIQRTKELAKRHGWL